MTTRVAALRLRWSDRDERYRMRRQSGTLIPLSDAELAAIRWWRGVEAERIGDVTLIADAAAYQGPRT